MNRIFKIFILAGLIALSGCGKNKSGNFYNTGNFKKHFGDKNGCFVLYDVNNRFYIRYNEELCNKKIDSLSANETVELLKTNKDFQNDYNTESENYDSILKGKSLKLTSGNTNYDTFRGTVTMKNETYYFYLALETPGTNITNAKDVCIKILNSLKIH